MWPFILHWCCTEQVFNVEFDPSETLPITTVPNEVLQQLAQAKAAYEAALTPTAIDPRFGFEWCARARASDCVPLPSLILIL